MVTTVVIVTIAATIAILQGTPLTTAIASTTAAGAGVTTTDW